MLANSFIKKRTWIFPFAHKGLEKPKRAAVFALAAYQDSAGDPYQTLKPPALVFEILHQQRLEIHLISANICLKFYIQIFSYCRLAGWQLQVDYSWRKMSSSADSSSARIVSLENYFKIIKIQSNVFQSVHNRSISGK